MRGIRSLVQRWWRGLSAQHVLLGAVMGWPVLYYLKSGEDVFQWPYLLQYVLLIGLLVMASRKSGWRSLSQGRWLHIGALFWAFTVYLSVITLVKAPIFLNGVAGYIKHIQFVPMLLVGVGIGLRDDLLRRWFVPYAAVLVLLMSLPLVLSTLGIAGWSPQSLFLGPGHASARGYLRYIFLFGNPNASATFLSTLLVFCLLVSISRLRRLRMALPVAIILVFGAYLVFLTLSRRMWVLLPATLVTGIALQRGLRRRVWLVAIVGIVFVGVLYAFWGPISDRLSQIFVFRETVTLRETGPLHVRLIFWDRVAGYMQTPLDWAFGLGSGTIGFAVRNYLSSGYRTIDGYYAILLAEYGLVGLALYSALVIAVLVELLRAILGRGLPVVKEEALIAVVSLALLVLLAGAIGNANSAFPEALYMWTFMGAGLALIKGAEPSAEKCDE